MNILLVEDEAILLNALVKNVLKVVPQANCYPFETAQEALELSEKMSIDIAFLDINIGDTDGITLANELKKRQPRVNIIFCTAFREYMGDAFDLYCSAYLMKPVTADKIMNAMENLRYSIRESEGSKVYFHCFGNFEAYYDGKPICFKYKRTKELLAYLVDRDGVLCSTKEIQGVLFEDEEHLSYFNQMRRELITTFDSLDASDVIIYHKGFIGVNKQAVKCDYFDYLDRKPNWVPQEYMIQYSFAESTIAR